jgi:putative transposase
MSPPAKVGFVLETGLDAWSRRIVGWAMGETLWSELVVEALNMAVWYGQPAMRVAHHSIEVIPASTFSRRREERAWCRRSRPLGMPTMTPLAEAFFTTLQVKEI